jgi:glucose-1-phosphate cytidylyltransferase
LDHKKIGTTGPEQEDHEWTLYGHKDFILCLGYKADVIKNYFRHYDECVSNDFVLSGGGKNVELLNSDIDDWRVTFVDTGLNSNIGMRLKAVEKHLQNEEVFLANYTDGLSMLTLQSVSRKILKSQKLAWFVGVKPKGSLHRIAVGEEGIR